MSDEHKTVTDESRFDIWRAESIKLIMFLFWTAIIFALGVTVGMGL